MIFESREDAGQQLARALTHYRDKDDVVVLALPRGGVAIGAEVARELHAPLGLVLVRKIGHPSSPEYAIGAMAEDEPPVYNESEVANVNLEWLRQAETAAHDAISQRRATYYGEGLKPPSVKGKTAIVVDDGMATGLTTLAAVDALTSMGASKVVVAMPVASPESVDLLAYAADEVIVLDDPANFLGAVGSHYTRFEQIDDRDVKAILSQVSAGV